MKTAKEMLDEVIAGKYQIHHKSFTGAAETAKKMAEGRGFTVDEDSWFQNVTTGRGRGRPSVGKTNDFHVELLKKGLPQRLQLHFQVFGLESGNFELNAYIG